MRHLSTDFTFDKAEYPGCNIWAAPESKTIYVHFTDEEYPRVSFFFHDEQGLINFKNEINWAFESFMRGKK